MIEVFDEVLRNFLKGELPVKNNEIGISFEQPNREWSARLNRPTLNVFLHDVRENVKLRTRHLEMEPQMPHKQGSAGNGSVMITHNPLRMDLHYLITAWAKEPEDEHSLLGRTLLMMFRHEEIPNQYLPEILHNQPTPIPIQVAQYDTIDKPSDIWNVLDNNQRAGVFAIFTVAFDPHEAFETPLVRTRELRIGQRVPDTRFQELQEEPGSSTYWTIGGTLKGDPSVLKNLSLELVEIGRDAEIGDDGRFSIGNLQAGEYTLEISGPGRESTRHPITVPSPDYDFEV